jgi:hypothetical protein
LNFEKGQLFVIDFEWLSVGRIRFGFYLFGRIFYCHQITNLNNLNAPYMVTPNLPIRFQLTVTDFNTTAKLTQICSCVMSEGQYNPIGKPFSASNGITGIAVLDNGTETPLLAIRGNLGNSSASNNQYYHQNIVPTLINVFTSSSNDSIQFIIRLYLAPNAPTIGTWTKVDAQYSLTEYAVGKIGTTQNITIDGTSIIVDKGYTAGRSSTVISNLAGIYSNTLQITSNVSNVSDVILISAIRVSNSATAYASINWEEIY